jgi:hypothetical protein
MRWGQGLLLALLAVCLAGCAIGEPGRAGSWTGRLRPFHGPAGSNVVQIDTFLVERPIGDRYLNEGLWSLADEQVVPLELKPVLEDNGLRIGVVAGLIPSELRELLTSERNCPDPRRLRRRAGETPTLLPLGPALPRCQFELHQDGQAVRVELAQAQCGLLVAPSLTADGRARLKFTPELRHGEPALMPRAAAEPGGAYSWVLQEQQPKETYPHLSWEVTLSANEYVVIGGRLDRPGTLGHQCLVRPGEARPVQRVLILRTAFTPSDGEPEDEAEGVPPLAVQATWPR